MIARLPKYMFTNRNIFQMTKKDSTKFPKRSLYKNMDHSKGGSISERVSLWLDSNLKIKRSQSRVSIQGVKSLWGDRVVFTRLGTRDNDRLRINVPGAQSWKNDAILPKWFNYLDTNSRNPTGGTLSPFLIIRYCVYSRPIFKLILLSHYT